jgi:hypothetical protein
MREAEMCKLGICDSLSYVPGCNDSCSRLNTQSTSTTENANNMQKRTHKLNNIFCAMLQPLVCDYSRNRVRPDCHCSKCDAAKSIEKKLSHSN